jgi:hypothetical protein
MSQKSNEKVLVAPVIADNVITFATWEYTGDKSGCGAGKGKIYGLSSTRLGVDGGLAALLLDSSTGNKLPKAEAYFDLSKYFPGSRGIPSSPVVTNGMIYISTSLNANQVINLPIVGWGTGKLKYWREVF